MSLLSVLKRCLPSTWTWLGPAHLDEGWSTAVGKPDALRTHLVALLVAEAVHLASLLHDALLLLLEGGFVVLGEVDDLPVLFVD